MKTIYKIHPLYFLIATICFFTGYIRIFTTITILIVIHELGHIIGMLFYNWKIEKIILLPFGALTIIKEKINKPIIEEFLITLLGPLFQIIFTVLINDKYVNNISYQLLLFNLLTIIPLDGSKLMNIFLNKIFSFKKSYILSIYISIIVSISIIMIYKNLIILLIIIFLLKEVYIAFINKEYVFNKFLYERYNYNINFKKKCIINDINKMKRDYNHIFKIINKYYTENEILQRKYFNNT